MQTIQPTVPAVATTDPNAARTITNTGRAPVTQPGGTFAEGDTVIVNDNDVNMRDAASTSGNVVDTLPEGTELTILSTATEEADGYIWWNVEDPLNATSWMGRRGVYRETLIHPLRLASGAPCRLPGWLHPDAIILRGPASAGSYLAGDRTVPGVPASKRGSWLGTG